MFIVKPSTFNPSLYLTKTVDDEHALNSTLVRYFDKDGFELTPLEREYYVANGVELTSYLENIAAHKSWIELEARHPSVFLDHSMLLERYQFAGDAAAQLERLARANPELWKLLRTRCKWGIDFSVDYITDNCVTDVFHVEFDSQSLEQLLPIKSIVEQIVLSTDWVDAGERIRANRCQWEHLEGKEQQNWKAKYFGFNAAEILCKTL